MSNRLGIWILVDNFASQRGWIAEHGLSLLVVTPDGRKILFDSGQGLALSRNTTRAGIRPEEIELVVLSHGHYDHGGGLSWFFGRECRPRLYAHPDVFTKRWISSESRQYTEVGLPWEARQIAPHIDLSLSSEPKDLGSGVLFSGEIRDRHPQEQAGEGFVIMKGGEFTQDPLTDDACLWIDIGAKRVVLLGCAHAGVIGTLDHIAKVAGQRPIELLIGGMHLIQADTDRLEWTVAELERNQIRHIVPLHCTGQPAAAYLANRLADRVLFAGAGDSFEVQA
jgi:7,8-dihydropterin-6-yl-methyl-4-(beta-D-ribofuranosyl)aminobenzene 5'-phosphate synthase